MKSLKNIFLLVACVVCISAAPVKNTCVLTKEYTVTIHGTSNLHDWDEKVGTVSGDGIVNLNDDGTYDVNKVTMKMEVLSIKSNKGSIMNKNTYKALKADDHPQIIFTLNTPVKAVKINGTEKIFPVKGQLTIAGVTRPVEVQVKVMMPGQGKLLVAGAQTIKMTDYDIKPPKALLGTLKTGNEITINFKTTFAIK